MTVNTGTVSGEPVAKGFLSGVALKDADSNLKAPVAREGVFKGLSVGLGAYPRRNVIYTALSRNGTLPGYTRFDLSMGYKVSPKLDFNLNVYNLTDEMYYLGVVSPTIFPGSPRGFRGTMRYTF
jgi:outer membrane receptor protein involved in Fe transport